MKCVRMWKIYLVQLLTKSHNVQIRLWMLAVMPPVEGRCTEKLDGGTDVEGLQKGTIPR